MNSNDFWRRGTQYPTESDKFVKYSTKRHNESCLHGLRYCYSYYIADTCLLSRVDVGGVVDSWYGRLYSAYWKVID